MFGTRDKSGILLVYQSALCATDPLTKLANLALEVVLRTPRLTVLSDFNIHIEAGLSGLEWDFMESMATVGLSQNITGLTYRVGHRLDLMFCTSLEKGGLIIVCILRMPLSWLGHDLLKAHNPAPKCPWQGDGPVRLVCLQ